MNKFFQKTVVVLVMLMSSIAIQASNSSTPKLTFKKDAPNTIVLRVSAINNPIQVVLQNSEGDLLFTETLEKGYTYKKKYDFSDFSDGIYYMKIVETTNVKFFKIEKTVENKIVEVEKLPFE
jgi:hypothetical protein